MYNSGMTTWCISYGFVVWCSYIEVIVLHCTTNDKPTSHILTLQVKIYSIWMIAYPRAKGLTKLVNIFIHGDAIPSTVLMSWLVMIGNRLTSHIDSPVIQFVIHLLLARYLVRKFRYIVVDFFICKISKVDWTSIVLMQCVTSSYPCHN